MTEGDLIITDELRVPRAELTFEAIRASGPGGQHVNKTSTAIELRFDVETSRAFTAEQRQRVLSHPDRRIGKHGLIVIKSREFRSQAKNRQAAEKRLCELLKAALETRAARIPTRPTAAQRRQRLDAKGHRSRVKRLRRTTDD